jgi:lipid-binding SYLF domain-containing protein
MVDARVSFKRTAAGAALVVLAWAPGATADDVQDRVVWAKDAYQELISAPDRGVPEALLEQTRCVAVVPHVIKAAFFFGGRFGKGILTCRDEFGEWSPIVFVTLGGPSFGLQFGAQSTDLVLFFRQERGVRRLLTSKLTLGGDASVAAGPVGRRASAEVDLTLTTDILSYARSRGVFIGLSLEGSYLGIDETSNEQYYGREVDPERVLFGEEIDIVPSSTRDFLALLP